MLAAKDQIRRHGPFRRLRRALIRQPQRILSRVRRVFVSLAPAIAPSRVRFAARFKKPLSLRARNRNHPHASSSSSHLRVHHLARDRAPASRPRRVRVAVSPLVVTASLSVRSRRARSFVRVRVDRSHARRARSRVRSPPARACERSTRDRSRAHLVERARRRAGVARGRVRRECERSGFVTRVTKGPLPFLW